MVSSKEILPVVLVSCAAILALVFLFTIFAEQKLTGQAAFKASAQLDKPYFRTLTPSSHSVKETCFFQHGTNCDAADSFCAAMTGNPASFASTCSKRAVTCELPCGQRGLNCEGGEFSTKPC
ncbi:hypothetical protein HY485_00600 [Candidatus Woesearchaeota archaeon]|nr:hypothetical protein [Candidatus Woesearchaeota archaeon]